MLGKGGFKTPTGGWTGKAGGNLESEIGVFGGVPRGVLPLLSLTKPEMPICIAALASIAPVTLVPNGQQKGICLLSKYVKKQ